MFQMQNPSQVNHNVPYKPGNGLQAPGDCPGSPDPLPPPSCAINNNHLSPSVVQSSNQNIYSVGLQKQEHEKMHSSSSYSESLQQRSGNYNQLGGTYMSPGGLVTSGSTQVYNSSNRSSSTSVDSGRGSVHAGGSGDSGSKYLVPSNPYQTSPPMCPPTETSQDSRSSSSSSLGSSLEQLDEGNASGDSPGNPTYQQRRTPPGQVNYHPGQQAQMNVHELKARGATDAEIIQYWLHVLQLSCYLENFIQAGYDLLTMARMTPEDLNAIGITNPIHRKRMKTELSRMNLPDPVPDFIPESVLEWLELLELSEYSPVFVRQGLTTVNRLIQLTWEDLEEIGIAKLGHQKKLMIAVERLSRLDRGNSNNQSPSHASASTSPKHNTNYPALDSGSRIPRPNQIPRTPPTPTSQRRSCGVPGQLGHTGEGGSQYSQLTDMSHGHVYLAHHQHALHYRNSTTCGPVVSQTNNIQGINSTRHSRSASLGPAVSSSGGGPAVPHSGAHTPPNPSSGHSTPTGVSTSRPIGRVTASLERKQRPPPPPPPKRITSIRPTTTSVSPNLQRRVTNPAVRSSTSIPQPRNAYENCPDMLPSNNRQPNSGNSNYSTYGFSNNNSSTNSSSPQNPTNPIKSNKPIQYVIGQPQQQSTNQKQAQYFFPHSHGQSNSGLQSDEFKGNSSPKVVYRKLSDGSLRNHQLSIDKSNEAAPGSSGDLTRHPGNTASQATGPPLVAQLSSSSVSSDENSSASNRRSRSSSSQSVESITSLPFANENCSTIRHRSPGPRPALASLDFVDVEFHPKIPANYQQQAGSSLNDLTSNQMSLNNSATAPSTMRKTLPLNLPYDTETRKRRPSVEPNPYALVRPPAIPMRRGSMSSAQASAENRVQLPKMDDGDNLSTNGEFEDICDILEDLTEMLDHEMNRNKSPNKEEIKKANMQQNFDKLYSLQ